MIALQALQDEPLHRPPRGEFYVRKNRERWMSDPSAPPLAHRKPEMRSLMGPFFFLFQSGLARPSDFRRLAFRPKLVSEGPASLSIRPSSKSRRIQKVTLFQCFAEISLRRSCRRSVCSRCEQRHPKAAWLCGLVRFSAGGAGPRDRSG
jgi:hypothetical protein